MGFLKGGGHEIIGHILSVTYRSFSILLKQSAKRGMGFLEGGGHEIIGHIISDLQVLQHPP